MTKENSNAKSGEVKVWSFVNFLFYPSLRQEKEVVVEDAEEVSRSSFIRCCETMEEKKGNLCGRTIESVIRLLFILFILV